MKKLSDAIIVALITGGLSLLGVILTIGAQSKSIDKKLEINAAVTETKLDELTREVRMHNDFARRIPVLEAKVEALERKSA